ncbi:hypothetical protein PQD71_gp099 [Kosakonia phage Kc263]|uniref:Uncharacterized protein n=1 Tax=Kosakonia phage Kc263 TaxID=2863194 RepID=A0AAE7WFT3_9CAUD|nr:hypothetical protein PQD71_gp099 [Kosakonia phage Kc263]QYN79992.1 hypothetical protein [Kosakonia phage Kc263]
MQKEEIFALLDQLLIDQTKYNKFLDYVHTFTREPRCKKGCLAFIDEIFNLPNVSGKEVLAITLASTKTERNAFETRSFIEGHDITNGYNDALKKARLLIMTNIAEYIKETSVKLSETTLSDKIERQVYLRRAVARLMTIFYSNQKTMVTEDQWSEVEACEWIDYLNVDLDTLTKDLCSEERMMRWSTVTSDDFRLHEDYIIRSMRTYLNYLDSFLKF